MRAAEGAKSGNRNGRLTAGFGTRYRAKGLKKTYGVGVDTGHTDIQFQFDLGKKSGCVQLVQVLVLTCTRACQCTLSSTPSSCTSQYYLPHYPPGHYPTSSSDSNSTNPSSLRRTANCHHKFAHLGYYSHSAPLPVGGVDDSDLLLPEP
jgi:hypothetical protein